MARRLTAVAVVTAVGALAGVLLLSGAAAAPAPGGDTPPWFYDGPSGPEHWHALDNRFASCGAGDRQSPINVVVTPPRTTTTQMHDLARPEGGLFHVEVKANNVPMQCDSESTCGRLQWANTTYALLDVHAHVPAEHQLNGRSFPLELHAVHVSADTKEIAVVGMLFDYLGAPHPLLQRLLDAKAAATNVTVSAGEWDNVVRPESGFCHLEGSLTTPPCTEGLNWFLQTDILSVSRVQVSAFAAIRGEGPAAGNARPLQDTNGREVVCYGPVQELAAEAAAANRTSPTPAPTSASNSGPACFPASAMVQRPDGTAMRLADVAVGDALRVGPDGATSEVYMWSHRLPAGRHPFVRLRTAGGSSLTASPGHLVYASGVRKPASAVVVGDTLPEVAANGTAAAPAVVVAVERVEEDGLYNPHTLSGDLLVDGFVVSTWTTAVPVAAARVALAPAAALYRATGWSVGWLHGGGGGWADAARTAVVDALSVF
ncbi:hypothetical protein MMPV_000425 [Pyropia vietnamensis]